MSAVGGARKDKLKNDDREGDTSREREFREKRDAGAAKHSGAENRRSRKRKIGATETAQIAPTGLRRQKDSLGPGKGVR